MVRALGVHGRAERVVEQVRVPAEELHREHAREAVDGRLLEEVVVVRDVRDRGGREAVVGARARDVVLVALDGAGRFLGAAAGRGGAGVSECWRDGWEGRTWCAWWVERQE